MRSNTGNDQRLYGCGEADLPDLIPQLTVAAQIQRKLLVDNPARLYGFV
jgi:hypothetical protein